MILLYSGASDYKKVQLSSSKSLGGYPSSTSIASGNIGSIFATLSQDASSHSDCKLIVLENTFTTTAKNLRISFTSDSQYVDYKIAAVAPAINSCQEELFELISFSNQLPQQAQLSKRDINNPIEISELIGGAIIGLWIQRSLKELGDAPSTIIKALNRTKTSCEEVAIQENISFDTTIEDNVELRIEYDLEGTVTTTTGRIYEIRFENVSFVHINHKLGYHPFVVVEDNGGEEVEKRVVHQNNNEMIVTFSYECSGIIRYH